MSDDVISGAVPIGFNFNYFGLNYSSLFISSNGFLTVLPGQYNGCCSGAPLPQNDSTNGTISAYWNDIFPPGAPAPPNGGVFYQTQGAPGSRQFIVQYKNVANCCDSTPAHDFEIKLFETSNVIEFHYRYVNNDGSTGSAGIEDHTGTIGNQFFIGTADIPDNTAVRYTPGGVGAAGDLSINANISASGGNGNVILTAGEDILHNSGAVSATGSGPVDYNAGGVITMADGTLATSGTGLITLDAVGNIQLSLVQTFSAASNAVTVTTTGGAITDVDGGAALDINANGGGVILSAATGIGAAGSGPTIEVDALYLDVSNRTSGGIFVTDTAGGLTLQDLNADTKSVTGVGGNGLITALSPLTIAADATTSGGMTYTSTDAPGATDHLTILAGVTVSDTTASLTFNAGDNSILNDTASISAATTATINIDAGNADAGAGAVANIFGALAAAGGASMNGNADNDTFNITGPTATALDGIAAAVTVNGFGGTNNLNLNDSLDVSGDTATITHTTVEGLGGSPGTDYTYSNIANLDVTATSAGDSLTTSLGGPVASPTSFNGLVNVIVRGNGGTDNMFLHVADSLTNASLDFVNLFGDVGGDNFGGPAPSDHIRPVLATGQTQIIINGDANAKTTGPVNPGTDPVLTSPDHLFLDLTTTDSGAAVTPVVIVDTNGGYADSANTQSFRYNGIEDIDLYDNGVLTNTAIGDFYVRATDLADYIQFTSTAQVNPVFRIRIGNIYYPTSGGSYGPYTTGGANPSRIFVYGRGGNDTITMYNTRVNAAFFGEDGNDILTGGYGNDLLVGGAGNDRINGAAVGGHDEIWGDDFNPATDTPSVASQSGTGNDQINTFGGNDTVYGQGGADIINSGAGDDYVNGGPGGDQIDGQSGNDRIYAGSGVDTASGSEGNDIVAGNDGNDALYGRTGNDIVIGGGGQDIVNGNEGSDVVVGDDSSYTGQNSGNLASGDLADAALLALMVLWGPSPDLGDLAGFGSAGDDDFVDTLWGGTEADAFFGAPPDNAADRNAVGYGPDLN